MDMYVWNRSSIEVSIHMKCKRQSKTSESQTQFFGEVLFFTDNNRSNVSKRSYSQIQKNSVLFIIKMKVAQTLLILIFLLVANSQNLQAEVQNPIYNPYKDMCSPVLMRRLANPTSMVSDDDAFLRVLETLKFAQDPQTVLNDLSFYSPRFVGLLLTYIQQRHLLLKQAKATDPAIRSRCLSRFKVEDCTNPCDSETIATSQIYNNLPNRTIDEQDPQCDIQFDNFYFSILSAYPDLAQQYLINLANRQDSQVTCNQMNPINSIVESECIEFQDQSEQGLSVQSSIQSIIDWFEQEGEFSSMIDLNLTYYYDESYKVQTPPQRVNKNINLGGALSSVRKLLNLKFGKEIFAEKSLKCIRADYLLMQTV